MSGESLIPETQYGRAFCIQPFSSLSSPSSPALGLLNHGPYSFRFLSSSSRITRSWQRHSSLLSYLSFFSSLLSAAAVPLPLFLFFPSSPSLSFCCSSHSSSLSFLSFFSFPLFWLQQSLLLSFFSFLLLLPSLSVAAVTPPLFLFFSSSSRITLDAKLLSSSTTSSYSPCCLYSFSSVIWDVRSTKLNRSPSTKVVGSLDFPFLSSTRRYVKAAGSRSVIVA